MPDIAGETRHSLDINVQDVQFLGQRGDSGSQQQVAQEYETAEVVSSALIAGVLIIIAIIATRT